MYNIRIIRVLSLLIMAAAAYVSYGTQRGVFLSWKVDDQSAAIAPIAIDMLAIICTLAIHTERVTRKGRRTAIFVLLVTVGGSTSANVLAGVTVGSKAVHGGMVLLYLMAEWVAAQVKQAPEAVSAAVAGQGSDLGTESPVEAIARLPKDAPVSPAVVAEKAARGARGDYGPRNGVEYADRTKRRKATGK